MARMRAICRKAPGSSGHTPLRWRRRPGLGSARTGDMAHRTAAGPRCTTCSSARSGPAMSGAMAPHLGVSHRGWRRNAGRAGGSAAAGSDCRYHDAFPGGKSDARGHDRSGTRRTRRHRLGVSRPAGGASSRRAHHRLRPDDAGRIRAPQGPRHGPSPGRIRGETGPGLASGPVPHPPELLHELLPEAGLLRAGPRHRSTGGRACPRARPPCLPPGLERPCDRDATRVHERGLRHRPLGGHGPDHPPSDRARSPGLRGLQPRRHRRPASVPPPLPNTHGALPR